MGWFDGWFGSVEPCDDCEEDTAHITVDDGASVCVHCGDFEGADLIEDEADDSDLGDTGDDIGWW